MDFKELAKIAAEKKKTSASTPEERIQRLERRVAREKAARVEAERTIEESSRRLYLANQEAASLNKELESTLQDLNETLGALTSAKAKRVAASITLVIAAALFFVTEFVFEPILEEHITSRFRLIVAKGLIFGTLIPVEILGSRIAERKFTESGNINESIYRDLLASAYDDGIITDMERNLLKSSARQLGINATIAKRIEHEVKQEREP